MSGDQISASDHAQLSAAQTFLVCVAVVAAIAVVVVFDTSTAVVIAVPIVLLVVIQAIDRFRGFRRLIGMGGGDADDPSVASASDLAFVMPTNPRQLLDAPIYFQIAILFVAVCAVRFAYSVLDLIWAAMFG